MSQHESEREDLMRDATSLRIRGEFRVPGRDETVIAGCRESGGWSTYFGQDPCYHFDPDGRLRRAYAEGRLYRTQGRTLAELRRVRSPNATNLMRRDLSGLELESFLIDMRQKLAELLTALRTGAAVLVRAVPEDGDVAGALARFLTQMEHSPGGLAPAIRTRPR